MSSKAIKELDRVGDVRANLNDEQVPKDRFNVVSAARTFLVAIAKGTTGIGR